MFAVKRICDDIGIMPVFAVIAERMPANVSDSLAAWQRQGAGIALHGMRHDRWQDWNEGEIVNDICKSRERLHERGFDTTKLTKLIVPPYACNTTAIRNAIRQQGCQMVTGASLVNPDRGVFMLGRISITPNTDTTEIRELLQKAYARKAFVIFGTHSSMSGAFSEKKTKAILQTAKDIGFTFII